MTRIRFARWAVVLSALAIVSAACAEDQAGPTDGETTPAEEGVFLMAADGVLSDTFMETPESEDMYFSGPAIPEESQAYPDFVDAYEQEYGEPPISAYHAHAYDAFNMLMAAVEEVAEVQGQTVTIDRTALREALYATSEMQGITGTLSCDVFGDCADPNIFLFHNGAEEETLADVSGNVVFEFDEGEDPLQTAEATAPDYATDVEPLVIGPGEPFKVASIQVISTESASLGIDQVRGSSWPSRTTAASSRGTRSRSSPRTGSATRRPEPRPQSGSSPTRRSWGSSGPAALAPGSPRPRSCPRQAW